MIDSIPQIGAQILDQAAASALQKSRPHAGLAKDELREKAEEFESVFLSQFMEMAMAGIKSDGPFGGGNGENMFRSMLSNEYAKSFSKQGGVGIADAVYRQLLNIQESNS